MHTGSAPPAVKSPPLLEVRALTIKFPGITANADVDVDLRAGEILGLLGENGAGKTSLVRALAGLVTPDSGDILLDGVLTRIDSPLQARNLGIQMVHQHFSLCPRLTVLENVLLARPLGAGRLRTHDAETKLRQLADQYGLVVDHTRVVAGLTVGERQIVEILKALSNDPRILILDEPTAVLSAPETRALYDVMERIANRGCGVILITHKLEELLRATQRVVVMRLGRVVDTFQTNDADVSSLARAMMGADTAGDAPGPSAIEAAELGMVEAWSEGQPPPSRQPQDGHHAQDGAPALQTTALCAEGSSGRRAIRDVNLSVFPGEIVGVAGIEGNGQSTVVEVLAGLVKPISGSIWIGGRDVTRLSAQARLTLDVAVIPEDRHHEATVPDMTVAENLLLSLASRDGFTKRGFFRRRKISCEVARLLAEYTVKTRPSARFRTLSGGNQQRLVLARELTKQPRLLIAAQPTRGLDVGGAAYVHEQLLAVAANGAGVIVLSSDLDELLLLASRIVVLHRGLVVTTANREDATRERLGLWMTGVRDDLAMGA